MGCVLKEYLWDTWVAQCLECLTLDGSSGLDFMVMSSGPTLGSVLGRETCFLKKNKKQTMSQDNVEKIHCL